MVINNLLLLPIPVLFVIFADAWALRDKHFSVVWRACNLTAFIHSSAGLVVHPFASVMRDPGSIPGGGGRVYFCETRILLLALSLYIGGTDVIDHCGFVWGGLHPESSLGRRTDNVIIPLDLTQLFCPGFHGCCRFSFRLHNWHSRLLGVSPVKSQESLCIHTQFHRSSGPLVCFLSWGARVQSPGGEVLMWNWDSPVSIVSLQWVYIYYWGKWEKDNIIHYSTAMVLNYLEKRNLAWLIYIHTES